MSFLCPLLCGIFSGYSHTACLIRGSVPLAVSCGFGMEAAYEVFQPSWCHHVVNFGGGEVFDWVDCSVYLGCLETVL
jgi:hypothetical protein